MKKESIAAVVVTYRSSSCIDHCLQSLIDAGINDIIVVDNASDDGTAEYIQRNYPNVCLITNALNTGFAAANNQALGKLTSDYVLLLNPDAWLEPEALPCMQTILNQYDDIAIVGPCVKRDGAMEPSLLYKPSFLHSLLFLMSGMRAMETGGFAGRVVQGFPWVSLTDGDHIRGSCMLIRHSAMVEVGLLDEDFFLYFEETEWCLRFRDKGWRIVIEPSAEAGHIGKVSVRSQETLPSLEFMRSAIIFWHKRFGTPVAWCLRGTLWLMVMTKWLVLQFVPRSMIRRQWLRKVASLAVSPYRMPMVYDKAKRPASWGE